MIFLLTTSYFQTGYFMDSSHFARCVIQITANNEITMSSLWYNSNTDIAGNKYFAVKYR